MCSLDKLGKSLFSFFLEKPKTIMLNKKEWELFEGLNSACSDLSRVVGLS